MKIYCTLNASPNKTKQKSQSTTRWEFVFMPELLALALLCTSFMRPLLLLLRTWRTTMAPSTPCIIISARCTHPRRRLLSTKQNKKKVHCFARPSIQAHLLEWQDLPRENCSDLLWSFSSWRRVLWICWLLGGREKLRILKKSFEFFFRDFRWTMKKQRNNSWKRLTTLIFSPQFITLAMTLKRYQIGPTEVILGISKLSSKISCHRCGCFYCCGLWIPGKKLFCSHFILT